MLVDDHPLWLDTLGNVLDGSGIGSVIAKASDGLEAIATAAQYKPDVVVMDMMLPGANGIEAARAIVHANPTVRVLMLSSSQVREDVIEAVKAGACGYLLKTVGAREVAEAVERVSRGELVFPPELASVVLEELRRPTAPPDKQRLRLGVVADPLLDREGLAHVLEGAGFDVVCSVATADALLDRFDDDLPDVAVVALSTGGGEAIVASVAKLRIARPRLGVLVLAPVAEVSHAFSLLSDGPGGIGYLLRERVSDLDQLTNAIRRTAAGESVIDPQVVRMLVSRERETSPLDALTPRERSVLALMAEGRTNQGISNEMHLSARTVEKYVGSIFTKLGLEGAGDDHRRVLAVVAYLRTS